MGQWLLFLPHQHPPHTMAAASTAAQVQRKKGAFASDLPDGGTDSL